MLTLLLLRHAKAEPAVDGDDRARALTDRGRHNADRLGTYLREHDLRPDLALVSSACRTRETAEHVAAALGTGLAIRCRDDLYNAGDCGLRAALASGGETGHTILLVGHNPGIMELAASLARQGDLGEIERLRGRFPPCGLAVIGFDRDDWAEACAAGGRLDALVFPEDLGA